MAVSKKKLIKCKINGRYIGHKVYWATTWWERTRGLMFKKGIGDNEKIDGMLIDYCNSVHTFFMRFPLDLLFLDNENRVVKVIENKSTWSMTFFYWKAVKVLELPVGQVQGIAKGDQLEVEHV